MHVYEHKNIFNAFPEPVSLSQSLAFVPHLQYLGLQKDSPSFSAHGSKPSSLNTK
jgi:hypothetical protein